MISVLRPTSSKGIRVVFVVLILVVMGNLATGFGLAVWLTRMPPGEPRTTAPQPRPSVPARPPAKPQAAQRKVAPARPAETSAAPSEAASGPTVSDDATTEPELAEGASSPAPSAEPRPVGELPEQWRALLDEKQASNSFVEASIHVLKLEVRRYRDQLIEIERNVRAIAEKPAGESLDAYLEQVRAANADWMQKQASAGDHLRSRQESWGDFGEIATSLENTLLEQTAQIETTNSNLALLDFRSDLGEGCQRLVREVGRLLDLCHGLRDRMHESLTAIVRHEDRLLNMDEQLRRDPLTGLVNRQGLEVHLEQWWQDDPARIRQLCVALFDLDRFALINESHGPRLADSLLIAVGDLLKGAMRKSRNYDLLGRLGGQRFMVVLSDTALPGASSATERLRGTLAAAKFLTGSDSISLTMSCGVAEVTADDTTSTLFDRLLKLVREAKKAGRDCSFSDQGHGPALVMLGAQDVPKKELSLDDYPLPPDA